MIATRERHRNILDFALSSLGRRAGRNLSLLTMYCLLIFVLASLLFFVSALQREAARLLEDAPDLVVQRMVAGRQDLIPENYGAGIAAIRGVAHVEPRLWGYYFDSWNGANYTVMASDKPTVKNGVAAIGSGVARSRKIQKGELFPLRTPGTEPLLLEVGTIFPGTSDLMAADLIILTPHDFHILFAFPAGKFTDLAVTVTNRKELPMVAAKIAALHADSRPILKSEIQRTYQAIFDWRGGMVLLILLSAVLSFIIFAWDRATGLSAEERKEIGILKSIGWDTSDVLLLKFWEGCAISLPAFLCGVIAAYCHVFFFSAPLFAPVLKGWSILYPQFQLEPVVDLSQLLVLFFFTVVPYITATIIPNWRTATMDPDAAMRS